MVERDRAIDDNTVLEVLNATIRSVQTRFETYHCSGRWSPATHSKGPGYNPRAIQMDLVSAPNFPCQYHFTRAPCPYICHQRYMNLQNDITHK